MWQAVFSGDATGFLVADGGVMDDSIDGVERVDLVGDFARLGDAGEITEDDAYGAGNGGDRILCAFFVAGVEDPSNFDKVQVGDTIVLTYNEATAISLKPLEK